jgi:hypothetical protein
VLKRNSMRFAAALLAALAGLVAVPNAALDAAPQHHDQVPGFYRVKVGDLEVTALYDGTGVFDPHWLNGTKATMDGVVEALHEEIPLRQVVHLGREGAAAPDRSRDSRQHRSQQRDQHRSRNGIV